MKFTPVMTLRAETAGAPQIPSARGTKSACGRRASAVGMLFYEIVEMAQAILVTYVLTDGSAQTVSDVVGVISTWLLESTTASATASENTAARYVIPTYP